MMTQLKEEEVQKFDQQNPREICRFEVRTL
jgi:hypothetical protein